MKRYIYIIIILLYSCSHKPEQTMTFSGIDLALKQPEQTKALKIRFNDLNKFCAHIDSFENLEFLVIESNKWLVTNFDGKIDPNTVTTISLPSNIDALKNLRILLLMNCYLDELPARISLLNNLKSIKLSYTKKASLPVELAKIKSLKSLKEIDLTNSMITPSLLKKAFNEVPNVKLTVLHPDEEPKY